MPEQIIVGRFSGLGTAEDARNRLRTEGFADSDMVLRELKVVGPLPQIMEMETSEFAIDPLFGITTPPDELKEIHNGETALCVRTRSEDDAQAVIDTLRQYAPIDVRVLAPSKLDAAWSELQRNNAPQ